MPNQRANSYEQLNDQSGGWIPLDTNLVFVSADSPIFVVQAGVNVTGSFGVGAKMWLTHQGQSKFFIVHATAVTGSNSYMTLYGGTDYSLNITGAITNPYFSFGKAPFGFPTDPAKYTVTTTDTTQRTQASPGAGTWYNLGGVNVVAPIGLWRASYSLDGAGVLSVAGQISVFTTLATSNNGETDASWTRKINAQSVLQFEGSIMALGFLNIATKVTYYLNTKSNQAIDTLYNQNAQQTLTIKLESAYL